MYRSDAPVPVPVTGPAPVVSYPMRRYTHWRSFTTANGLPSNDVKVIKVDGDRVWAGTDDGLACYENGKWRVYGVADGLPHQAVLALDIDKATGDLWIGTAGGAARLSAGRFDTFNQLNSGLANDLVYGLCCYNGDVWFATASGVSRYSTKTREWSIYNQNNTVMFEPWCYAVSAGDNMVYVGVWGGGIVEYNLNTGYWRDYKDPDGENEICLIKDAGPVHNVVPAVSFVNGKLWAGSYFGLSTYDGRHWKNYFNKDSGLASDFINFVRAQGNIGWICTDTGLSSFDGTTWVTYRAKGAGGDMEIREPGKKPEHKPMVAGLADNYLFGVDFQNDKVWVATASGVSVGSPS